MGFIGVGLHFLGFTVPLSLDQSWKNMYLELQQSQK